MFKLNREVASASSDISLTIDPRQFHDADDEFRHGGHFDLCASTTAGLLLTYRMIDQSLNVLRGITNDADATINALAYALGQSVAQHSMILVTDACPGLPYEYARRNCRTWLVRSTKTLGRGSSTRRIHKHCRKAYFLHTPHSITESHRAFPAKWPVRADNARPRMVYGPRHSSRSALPFTAHWNTDQTLLKTDSELFQSSQARWSLHSMQG